MRVKKYADMYELPHHVSKKYPQMSILNRAAQFAPFAALTGFEDHISEEARLTSERKELTEAEREELDERLRELENGDHIEVVFFVPDRLKGGGSYDLYEGYYKRVDTELRQLVLMDGTRLELDEIYKIIKRKEKQYE